MSSQLMTDVFGETNRLAWDLAKPEHLRVYYREIKDRLAHTDQLVEALEQLNLHDIATISRENNHLYLAVQELCSYYDVGFRVRSCRIVQELLDTLYTVQEHVMREKTDAWKRLKQLEEVVGDGGDEP